MYKIEDIRRIHLEITDKCNAKCPMCERTKSINNGSKLFNNEITLEVFEKWFPINFIKQLNQFQICGNLGDGIYAKDTLKIFKYLRQYNNNILLILNTNGSARNFLWWQELAQTGVRVIFAIDGLKDTHHLYRVNTDWDKIINNAKTFIKAGGSAYWAMLVFKHNEHQIEDCRKLAKEIKFEEFHVKHTTRFKKNSNEWPVYDGEKNLTHILEPTSISENFSNIKKKVLKLTKQGSFQISCQAIKKQSIYISADGVVMPCCWIGSPLKLNPSIVDYNKKIGNYYSLYDYSLEEIFNTGIFEKIKNTWDKDPLKVCSSQCSFFKQNESQYIEKNKISDI